ncbi:MAG: DUF2069 domain-containing protein [Pseudomonadota bacterium]
MAEKDKSDDAETSLPGANVQGWLFLSLVMMGSLVAVTGLRQLFFDPIPSTGTNIAWFIVQLIPLLVPLPGFLRGSLTSTFILCLASLLYFIHGVMLAFDPELSLLGICEVFFAVGLTGTTTMVTRKLREQRGA